MKWKTDGLLYQQKTEGKKEKAATNDLSRQNVAASLVN